MDDGKLVYFYLKEGMGFKKRRWSRGHMPVSDFAVGDAGMLGCCGVPEFFWKNRMWDKGKLKEELGRILEEQKAEDYYLQPELARLAEVEEKMPPEILLQKVLSQIPCPEYLIYIGWGSGHREGALGEEAFREERRMLFRLLEPYLARVNHFTLVTDRPEGYEEFTDYIYEEYGIPTANTKAMGQRFGKSGKTVVLDMRKEGRASCREIPPRAAYVDFWSDKGKREELERERKDIRYLSAVKFLDTLVKNGYNTIVNSRK